MESSTLVWDLRPGEGGIKSSWEKDVVRCPHFRGGKRERIQRQRMRWWRSREGDVKEGKGENFSFS